MDLRNRANANDRPLKVKDLREGGEAAKKCIQNGGHQMVFLPKDNYGCCKKCGEETLT